MPLDNLVILKKFQGWIVLDILHNLTKKGKTLSALYLFKVPEEKDMFRVIINLEIPAILFFTINILCVHKQGFLIRKTSFS